MRQILPYIRAVARRHPTDHDSATAAASDDPDCPELTSTTPTATCPPFDPQPGSFVLLPNEGGQPYQLLRITERDGHGVKAHYLNTTDKERRRRFRLCWQHDTELERQHNTKPRHSGYTAWIDDFGISDFCQRTILPTKVGHSPAGSWFNLPTQEIRRTLAHPPL